MGLTKRNHTHRRKKMEAVRLLEKGAEVDHYGKKEAAAAASSAVKKLELALKQRSTAKENVDDDRKSEDDEEELNVDSMDASDRGES